MNIEPHIYNELCSYTLAHAAPSFIHQHVVDAIHAQTCTACDRPLKLAFALVGLYLHIEKEFTGKQVQLVHTKLARRKQSWPVFLLPQSRGAITIKDVIAAPAGAARDRMIHQWCLSVWEAFCDQRPAIIKLLTEHQIL
ncbi:MAG: hypothetical protein JST84_12930 [Acidobacteria bacterium]|nr:hypothetical protein [Acidobacteriota bacterium]